MLLLKFIFGYLLSGILLFEFLNVSSSEYYDDEDSSMMDSYPKLIYILMVVAWPVIVLRWIKIKWTFGNVKLILWISSWKSSKLKKYLIKVLMNNVKN